MRRKRLTAFILAVLCLFVLTGCQDNPVTTVGSAAAGKVQEYDFPENGIVTKADFEALQGTVDTSLYKNFTDSFSYVWTFNGADINNPMDFNITVTPNSDDAEAVSSATGSQEVYGFQFADNENVPGKYNLKMHLPLKWDCQSIDLYQLDKTANQLKIVGTVKMDNSTDNTIVNFGINSAKGQFYLVSSNVSESDKQDTMIGSETTTLTTEEKDAQKQAGQALKQQIINDDNNYTGTLDGYQTQLDKIPSGQPMPVEPANTEIDYNTTKQCTLEVRCDTIWWEQYNAYLNAEKAPYQPKDGTIFAYKVVDYHPGEMVFDVLNRELKNAGIQMEYSYTPIYGSNYIEGINNLYEFDCGELSGWMYEVNGWYPNYGCSRYLVKEGDTITWNYTCNLGRDLGQSFD